MGQDGKYITIVIAYCKNIKCLSDWVTFCIFDEQGDLLIRIWAIYLFLCRTRHDSEVQAGNSDQSNTPKMGVGSRLGEHLERQSVDNWRETRENQVEDFEMELDD